MIKLSYRLTFLFFLLCPIWGISQNKNTDWPINQYAHKNIVGSTGYGLKKGDFFFQNYLLGFNQFAYGVTDKFSIGGALELFSLGAEIEEEKYYTPGFAISPRFSIPVNPNKVNLSIGGLIAEIPDTDNFLDIGVLFGQITVGSPDRNFSFGFGFGFAEGEFVSEPAITIAGNWRLSKSISLMTENWIFPALDGGFYTLGVRWLRKRLSWDFAIVTVASEEEGENKGRPVPVIGILLMI